MVLQHANKVLAREKGGDFSFGSINELLDYVLNVENNTQIGHRFSELISAPEQDGWIYKNWNSTGPDPSVCTDRPQGCDGPSMICEVFVYAMYKAAGVFGDATDSFQATEVDGRSAYIADLFNTSFAYDRAKYPRCAAMVNASGACQILGQYELPLPGLSSVEMYPHYAERCQDVPPDYTRLPAQC